MKINRKLKVAIVGCGLIGRKRARWVQKDPRTRLQIVVDADESKARSLAGDFSCQAGTNWLRVISDPEIDLVVVSTPNHLLCEISCAALKQGKDVLVEKPMGRNVTEARRMALTAQKYGRKLKLGFNHRYHPAIHKAHEILKKGEIGKLINLRAQYGHGGRMGYEKEWRAKSHLAGGGELTDQGVHLIDLIQWICGMPSEAIAFLQTIFWKIRPSEDNGFALLKFKSGVVANFHSSWTQWKNLFNLEIFGTKGFLTVHGLGGSYGPEKLTVAVREKPGQVPKVRETVFAGEDLSWKEEWGDFVRAVLDRQMPFMGNAEDGLRVMKVLDALYRSHRLKKIVSIY